MSLPHPGDWYQIIRSYILQGAPREALFAYTRLRVQGLYALEAIPLVLKACGCLSLLNQGKNLHAESLKSGLDSDIVVGTSVVSMYAKCGDIQGARKVFDLMHERNVVTWNAIIGGYLANRDTVSAMSLFGSMSERTSGTWNQLIDGVAKCGDLRTARDLFDNVPIELRSVATWTVMVDGYARYGYMEAAWDLFEEMPDRNNFVWSSMISGYCRIGDVKQARLVFDRNPVRNLVNWNSLLSGLVQNGYFEEAIELFARMQSEGIEPDEVTVSSALSACAQLGSLDMGKKIHNVINEKCIKPNRFVRNGLVDMYIKCGDIGFAELIFDEMSQRDIACWNSMISGFGVSGYCREAVEFFHKLEGSDETPDDISFLAVLSACAHGGLVEEGLKIFSRMEKYSLTPSIKHYSCLIDLLGKVGKLREAFELVKSMPVKPNDIILGSLLAACQTHSDSTTAEEVLKYVSSMVTGNESHYALLSNIYAASDKWGKAENIRMAMVERGLRKTPGHSSVSEHNWNTRGSP